MDVSHADLLIAVVCGFALVAAVAVVSALLVLRRLDAALGRLLELERAGFIIHPKEPPDAPLLLSRRQKIHLAEARARDRAQRMRAGETG